MLPAQSTCCKGNTCPESARSSPVLRSDASHIFLLQNVVTQAQCVGFAQGDNTTTCSWSDSPHNFNNFFQSMLTLLACANGEVR